MGTIPVEQRRNYYGSFTYIDGIRDYQARKIAAFAFGEYFNRLVKNNDKKTYDIFVKEGVDMDSVNWFKNGDGVNFKGWGPGYRIFEAKEVNGETTFMEI